MYVLRNYQIEAVDRTIEHFQRSHDPALIVLPTGAGKSLVIADLALKAHGRVLVLAHVKELVEQNHEKYESYGNDAGIFSASLNRKDLKQKVIFASIQSFINNEDNGILNFSLIIIDECHRISLEPESQYQKLLKRLQSVNSNLKILGLTATPYRLDTGWIYNFHYKNINKESEERFFKKCIYELSLRYMIKNEFLTPPVLIDSPVASYDFSSLFENRSSRTITKDELNKVLQDQKRITPVIIKDIVNHAHDKKGVMIFTSTIKHAKEVFSLLPAGQSQIIIGNMPTDQRALIINDFKNQKLKYLVNVSVLTTGFDAPHVDLIAILRPTESISLYQQIVGRGLRLYPGKKECLILDYTGLAYNLFTPQIDSVRPSKNSVPVKITCPKCDHNNDFWGILDLDGDIVEHFGRKCQGAFEGDGKIIKCDYFFRFKLCNKCDKENDISAHHCSSCNNQLIDADTKLKEARALKDAHIMRVDSMQITKSLDKKTSKEVLHISYYDVDANELSEYYFLETQSQKRAFYYNFIRSHLKLPDESFSLRSSDHIIASLNKFRKPVFIIARQRNKLWQIREKIFQESLRSNM